MSNILKLNIKPNSARPRIIFNGNAAGAIDEFQDTGQIIEKEKQKSFENGFEQGYQKAKDDLEQEYITQAVNKSEEFYGILSSFENQISNYASAFDTIVIKLSKMIAEKIVRKEVEISANTGELLKDALSEVIGANKVLVKLNSNDLNFLMDDGKLENYKVSFPKIVFESDDTITKGGCLIETEIGNVDARIESQLAALERQMMHANRTVEE